MSRRFLLSGLCMTLVIVLFMIAVIPVTSTPSYQLDATQQEETVRAIVQERLTSTAIGENTDTPVVTVTASITPVPTLTMMPSPTFESDLSGLQGVFSNDVIVVDVDMDTYEQYINGWEQYWHEDYQDAEDLFDDLIELEPQWSEAYFARAINHFAREDYEDALDDIEIASELAGQVDTGILSWRIVLYREFNLVRAAIRDGERIIAENPYDTVGLNQLAIAYFVAGDYEAAIETVNLLFLYDPTTHFNYEIRRDAYEQLDMQDDSHFDNLMLDGILADDTDEKIEYFEDAIAAAENTNQVKFNRVVAYWNLALIYFLDGDTEPALDALDNAEEAYPQSGNIYYLRSITQFGNVSDRGYLDILNTGIERAPDFADSYILRALYHEAFNDDDLALLDQWRYLQLTRSHTLLWQSIDPLDEVLSFPLFKGWQHRLLVDAEEGDRLTVSASLSNIGENFVDPMIVILDIDGNPLASNDDEGNESYNAEIRRLRLPADGQYTIIIASGTGGIDGIVEVEVELD